MKIKRCLYCYYALSENEVDFHEKCSRIIFGRLVQPKLSLDKEELERLANEIVNRSIAVPGVQPKLSLTIENIPGDSKNSRMTIVGFMGNYILKPQSIVHESLPENEHLTMYLATIFGIKTAKNSLIRTTSGELAYITKRFDRVDHEKLQCEDLCQLSELLTEKKYNSSMEKAGKLIKANVANPILDALYFFEIALFSFLTGNADMHLKNFSILRDQQNRYNLSPAYDLLNTRIANKQDQEEMALTINSRKNKIKLSDFDALALSLGINEKQAAHVYNKLELYLGDMLRLIKESFLPDNQKKEYEQIFLERTKRLFPNLVTWL